MEDYFQIRNELLRGNFVFKELLFLLRKKFRAEKELLAKKQQYHRNKPEFSEWQKQELFNYYKKHNGQPPFYKDIQKVATALDVDFGFLFAQVTLNRTTAEEYFVFTVTSPASTTLPEGVYIKYKQPMNERDWKTAERQARSAYRNFYNIKELKSRKDIGSDEDRRLYIEIEKKIRVIYRDRKPKKSRMGLQNRGGTEKSIVSQAIGEALSLEISDKELKRAEAAYYRIARRFSLPTLRDLANLQSIIS